MEEELAKQADIYKMRKLLTKIFGRQRGKDEWLD